MSLEIRALKAQIHEMKEMLKMGFDMQLDIQRAIRQEVAAAMAANLGKCKSFEGQKHDNAQDGMKIICTMSQVVKRNAAHVGGRCEMLVLQFGS